jgi:fructokinase
MAERALKQGESPCIFGEVLFDCFPAGERVLGGAPFNVAWHLQAFGEAPLFISRVGMDEDGRAILEAMQHWGMRRDGIQIDATLPTGRVDIRFTEDGEPAYDIVHPCAYDAIEAGESEGRCTLIYHGSLALRDARSREALLQLTSYSTATVFVDVNLRPPWWQAKEVAELLEAADWVKLNAGELKLLAPCCDARGFVAQHRLQGLILTHGADGAQIVTTDAEAISVRPGKGMAVIDTVGAGDAFAAVTLLGLIRGWPMAITASRAQDFASRMVGQRGATVKDRSFYESVMTAWQSSTQRESGDV